MELIVLMWGYELVAVLTSKEACVEIARQVSGCVCVPLAYFPSTLI